jgi:protein-tyrosine phosphatase
MYTDLHGHYLPGVDDGAGDLAESREMLDQARGERASVLCVTPHIWPDRFPNRPAELRARFEEWKGEAEARGFQVHLGSEVYFRPDLPEAWVRGELLPLGERSRYLLVELPLLLCPPGVAETFYRLRLEGAEPLLAHPERYPWASRDLRRLEELAEAGVPFQVTAASLLGHFGATIQKTAWTLLERGWVHVVASDAHSPTGRRPLLREAVRAVSLKWGTEAAHLLFVKNPRAVLEGRAPQAPPVKPVRRRFGR